jgi:type VI secretion system protein ImpK
MTALREQLDSFRDVSAQGNGVPAAAPILPNLVVQIAVSRATELARAGRYDDAETLLRDLVPAGLPPMALDLLARIRAQQGRWAEAKTMWLQVSQLDPSDRAAQVGLERIARIEERHQLRGPSPASGYARLRRFLRWDKVEAKSPQSDSLLELKVSVPGVSLQKMDDEVVLTFNFNLFSGAVATLEKKGQEVLSALGWQLEPYVGRIAIEVIGQPDALPQESDTLPRDVSALGMTRAVVVFSHLTETTKLQARMFSLRTGEDFLRVSANDSAESRSVSPAIVLNITELKWQSPGQHE